MTPTKRNMNICGAANIGIRLFYQSPPDIADLIGGQMFSAGTSMNRCFFSKGIMERINPFPGKPVLVFFVHPGGFPVEFPPVFRCFFAVAIAALPMPPMTPLGHTDNFRGNHSVTMFTGKQFNSFSGHGANKRRDFFKMGNGLIRPLQSAVFSHYCFLSNGRSGFHPLFPALCRPFRETCYARTVIDLNPQQW